MGGAVSAGHSNDDLIDNLLDANYIKTPIVERVFRAVDRGEYFLPEPPINPYKDLAWRSGHFHISAPCIYSEVMEGLKLKPGLSFLNLGSGTGYLSTMVGLILGSTGINHGVEIYEDVIAYANKKLDEFKAHSGAMDEYDFCEPKFIQGNCLCIANGCQLYDRVYCGAACPENYINYMKNLIKIDGILIVPLNEQLMEIKRKSETVFYMQSLLTVSFANVILPSENNQEMVHLCDLLDVEPLSLQELCRSSVRNILRKIIDTENPLLRNPPKRTKSIKKKRTIRTLVVPFLDSETSDDDDFRFFNGSRRGDADRTRSRRRCCDDANPFLNFLFDQMHSTIDNNKSTENVTNETKDENMEVETNRTQQVEAIIEHDPSNEDNTSRDNTKLKAVDESCDCEEPEGSDTDKISFSNLIKPETSSGRGGKTRTSREKFDSGLGDEIIEATASTSSDEDQNDLILQMSSSDEENGDMMQTSSEDHQDEGYNKRSSKVKHRKKPGRKLRKVDLDENEEDSSSSSSNSDSEASFKKSHAEKRRMYKSPYSVHMKNKIQQLPLPPILKNYLNFYRPI